MKVIPLLIPVEICRPNLGVKNLESECFGLRARILLDFPGILNIKETEIKFLFRMKKIFPIENEDKNVIT